MRIALDAMGGDHAPEQIVKGAFDFLREVPDQDIAVVLVGHQDVLRETVRKYPFDPGHIDIVHASGTVSMDEKPARIVKTKPESSLVRAVKLVQSDEADGVISAGNTGALLSASLFLLKPIPGVRRPALCPFIPTPSGGFVLGDAGANVDVRASDLVQFAVMARAYSIHLCDLPQPRTGLLNIGTEPGKGNELTIKAHDLLAKHVQDFVGNVEPRDLFIGAADVVVCDGFVGNILVKFGEGLIKNVTDWAKKKLRRHPISLFALPLMRPALKDLYHDLDHEEYGGWPLLGLNGVAIVCHGSSSAKAIKNALKTATQCVSENLINSIEKGISAHLDIFEENHALAAS